MAVSMNDEGIDSGAACSSDEISYPGASTHVTGVSGRNLSPLNCTISEAIESA
jgi:hypothetical protein